MDNQRKAGGIGRFKAKLQKMPESQDEPDSSEDQPRTFMRVSFAEASGGQVIVALEFLAPHTLPNFWSK